MSLQKLLEIKERLPPEYADRLKQELDVIVNNKHHDMMPYFVELQDDLAFLRKQGIPVGMGRGSAGGSLVCYLMGITQVDPIEYNLPFSRFLSHARLNRGKYPDVDTDIPASKRGVLIDYIFKKHGDKAAHVATFSKLKLKNSLLDSFRLYCIQPSEFEITSLLKAGRTSEANAKRRELDQRIYDFNKVRKSLGNSPVGVEDIDWLDGYEDEDGIKHPGILESNEVFSEWCQKNPEVIANARKILKLPRQLGCHAGGIVIADKPITTMVPVFKDDGVNTIAYDKKTVQKLGLVKYDFLGLKNLDFISDCVDLVRKNYGVEIDYANLPDVPEVYSEYTNGSCLSVFQVGTSGAASFMKKLDPKNKKDVIVSVALNRPGALDAVFEWKNGEKMPAAHAFIEIKAGRMPLEYLHNDLEPYLKDTYGVICYQEQVSKIIQDLLDFTEEEADEIREAISDKNPKAFEAVKARLPKLLQRGWSQDQIDKLFNILIAFASYSFNCIAGDQKIMTKTGPVNMSDICKDLSVFEVAFKNQAGTISYEKPSRFKKSPTKRKIYKIFLSDGSTVMATEDHKFLSGGQWKTVKQILKEGASFDKQVSIPTADSLNVIGFEEFDDYVYDIEMPTDHNFILENGTVAHNCSHATVYGLTSYATAFLKHFYPLEWWCAVLSHSTSDEIQEKYWPDVFKYVTSPDVNNVSEKFQIKNGKLLPPLTLIDGVGKKACETIAASAPYSDLSDFFSRVPRRQVNSGVVWALFKAGALDSLMDKNLGFEDRAKVIFEVLKKTKKDVIHQEYTEIDDFKQFLLAKEVLSIAPNKLSEAIKNTPGISRPFIRLSHYLGDGSIVDFETLRGQLKLVDGRVLHNAFANMPDSGLDYVDVCSYGYVRSMRLFPYQEGTLTALELNLDFDNYPFKIVVWPSREETIPKIANQIKEKTPFLFKIRLKYRADRDTTSLVLTGLEEIKRIKK